MNMNHFKIKEFIIIILCGFVMRAAGQQSEIQLAAEYWNKGDREKAYQTYRDLAREPANLQAIHSGYLNALLELKKFKEAHEHMAKLIKRYPTDPIYKLDDGLVWLKEGDITRSNRIFGETIATESNQQFSIKSIADYFLAKGIPEYAEQTLLSARKTTGLENLFALELANVYRIRGKKMDMVEEYLNYVSQTPSNSAYVRNLLSLFLTRPEDQDLLQEALYLRVQRFPDAEIFADLLIWSLIQQKNFENALVQAKAYDRRFGKGSPARSYELAQIATNNREYDVAAQAYEFIIRSYRNSEQYLPARLGLLQSMEKMILSRYPVNRDSVSDLRDRYRRFASDYESLPNGIEARIHEARLLAFHLDRLDSAAYILNNLIQLPGGSVQLKSRARLELGDIYLIRAEYWESTLVYSQVEKAQKDSPLGHEAKFRNARLNYFKGDFRLAEEHLDVLKQATSREVANDALDLSLRIKENTMVDTLGRALGVYAVTELLIQQNRAQEALAIMPVLYSGDTTINIRNIGEAAQLLSDRGFSIGAKERDSVRVTLPSGFSVPTIRDDVFWLEAGLHRKAGDFLRAERLLQRIVSEYPKDVLADDAEFMLAEISERDIKDADQAMQRYRDFLTKHPGSVYAAEARKRFRTLRGDFLTAPESN